MAIGVNEYIGTVTYLSKMYDFFNEKLFCGALEKPVITISPDEKNKAYGWITRDKLWKESENDEGMYEINISAQFLNRSIAETASTLIHEMCHQWAKVNDFKDTARSGSYHNKLFTLTESTAQLLGDFVKLNPGTPIYRIMPIKPKRVRNLSVRKYICPDCEAVVRATKAVNVICRDCIKQMQEEE